MAERQPGEGWVYDPQRKIGVIHYREGVDYENLDPLSVLPESRGINEFNPIPLALEDATIIKFGAAPSSAGLEGGGLIIDYRPNGSTEVIRAVLEFNENGMWLSYLRLNANRFIELPNQGISQE